MSKMFRKKIDELRKKQRLSVSQLIEKLGMSEGGYHSMLNTGNPKTSTLLLLAKELKCSVDYLINDNDRSEVAEAVLEKSEEKNKFEQMLAEKDKIIGVMSRQLDFMQEILSKKLDKIDAKLGKPKGVAQGQLSMIKVLRASA